MNSNIDENRLLELEQKKLEAIDNILHKHTFIAPKHTNDHGPWILISEFKNVSEEILSTLSQFDDPKTEPLEVEIVSDNFRPTTVRFINCNGLPVVLYECAAKQEAIDFCKRHGLKIKE